MAKKSITPPAEAAASQAPSPETSPAAPAVEPQTPPPPPPAPPAQPAPAPKPPKIEVKEEPDNWVIRAPIDDVNVVFITDKGSCDTVKRARRFSYSAASKVIGDVRKTFPRAEIVEAARFK